MTLLFGFIHVYGLLIGLGVAAGLWLVDKSTRHFGKDTGWIESSLPWIVVGAVIGARAYHLLTDWQLYIHASLWDLFAVWKGGLGFLGATFGGALGLWFWTRREKSRNIFLYFDLLAFGAPLAQAIGRLGNFFNRELYGVETSLPWGLLISGRKHHPLFLYEALANLCLLGLLWGLARQRALVPGKGQYAFLYLFGYAMIRFWLEYLRIETARWQGILGVFSIAQWFCAGLMLVSVVGFWTRRHWPHKEWDFSLN